MWKGRSEIQFLEGERVGITNRFGAASLQKLRAAGVTHVVCVSLGDKPEPHSQHVRYLHVCFSDHYGEQQAAERGIREAVLWVERVLAESEQNRALIHCDAGRSRSGAILVSWLKHRHPELSWDEALQRCREVRPIIDPSNFIPE